MKSQNLGVHDLCDSCLLNTLGAFPVSEVCLADQNKFHSWKKEDCLRPLLYEFTPNNKENLNHRDRWFSSGTDRIFH